MPRVEPIPVGRTGNVVEPNKLQTSNVGYSVSNVNIRSVQSNWISTKTPKQIMFMLSTSMDMTQSRSIWLVLPAVIKAYHQPGGQFSVLTRQPQECGGLCLQPQCPQEPGQSPSGSHHSCRSEGGGGYNRGKVIINQRRILWDWSELLSPPPPYQIKCPLPRLSASKFGKVAANKGLLIVVQLIRLHLDCALVVRRQEPKAPLLSLEKLASTSEKPIAHHTFRS